MESDIIQQKINKLAEDDPKRAELLLKYKQALAKEAQERKDTVLKHKLIKRIMELAKPIGFINKSRLSNYTNKELVEIGECYKRLYELLSRKTEKSRYTYPDR